MMVGHSRTRKVRFFISPRVPSAPLTVVLDTGNTSQAVVEFAPYQKIPPAVKVKADARQGTIEEGEPLPSLRLANLTHHDCLCYQMPIMRRSSSL
jgi:hypothetical protein